MDTTLDFAYKLGCGRLIFEHGAMDKLGAEAKKLGSKAWVVIGPHAREAAGTKVFASLDVSGIAYEIDEYSGACCEEKAQAIADRCREKGCNLVIGVGGGKIMDLAKISAHLARTPVINVPTISATCASYTPLSLMYAPDWTCIATWYLRDEINCVLCDLDILCAQPARCLAAGILDSMAKHVEIQHYHNVDLTSRQDLLNARALANMMYIDLVEMGQDAVNALKAGKVTPALERCIFHTIVTTGLISGTARGQFQSALAHALYEEIRIYFTEESRPYLHGEVVAVGMLLQSLFLGRETDYQQTKKFMEFSGVPCTLAGIGAQCDDAMLRTLAEHEKITRYLSSGEETARVLDILKNMA